MNTIGWIMTDSNGIPYTKNFFDLYKGFTELGIETKFYTPADIFTDFIPSSPENVVVGHIDQCRKHIKNITNKDVDTIDYPTELIPFMKRKFKKTTLNEVYKLVNEETFEPFFIKSVEQKHFTGFVCKNFNDYISKTNGCYKDFDKEVYMSEVLDIKSEYRTYVHWHNIENSIRYSGAYNYAPSKQIIEDMLYALRDSKMPVAYSIDVGIISSGETVLIECNDGFALGNYGLPSRVYAQFHLDRWNQLCQL